MADDKKPALPDSTHLPSEIHKRFQPMSKDAPMQTTTLIGGREEHKPSGFVTSKKKGGRCMWIERKDYAVLHFSHPKHPGEVMELHFANRETAGGRMFCPTEPDKTVEMMPSSALAVKEVLSVLDSF